VAAAVLAAASAGALLFLRGRQASRPAPVVAWSFASPQAPLDFLLQVPGAEMLEKLPSFRSDALADSLGTGTPNEKGL